MQNNATTRKRVRKFSSDFWKYWTGQTISNLGSSITLFALPLLVYKISGSALDLGIASAATFLPYLLLGLILGAWADRVNRKRMMITTDVGRALVILTIPLLFALGLLTLWWIYIVAFIHATLTICFEAGEFAAIPSLVNQEDLVTANGRIQASYSGASIVGPLLAGVLVTLMPLSALLMFDSLSFLVSSFSLALISISFNKGEKRAPTSIRSDVVEGLHYVFSNPVLRNISIMMALVNFVGSTAYAQLIFFAKSQLQATDFQASLLYSAGSLGVVILALAAGPLRKHWSFSTVALGALMLEGILTVVFSLMRMYWAAIVLWTLIGGLGILFNINTGSLRQTIVPNNLLGRVMSIASVIAWSAIPLGSLLGGFAISWTQNVALVYGVIGALIFLISFGFSFTALGHADKYISKQNADEMKESQKVLER
ncbi:MAG: MFS transporter [Ktedonobacteraceae bacterium]